MGKLNTTEGVAEMLNDLVGYLGISVRDLAKSAEVSEKTARNWLDALSEPKTSQLVTIFEKLNVPMIPFSQERTATKESELRKQLHYYIDNLATDDDINNLHYVLTGKHGSSASSVLVEAACNMSCTMHHRYQVANSVLDNYLYDLHKGDNLYTVSDGDMARFEDAIKLGREAALRGEDSYNQTW